MGFIERLFFFSLFASFLIPTRAQSARRDGSLGKPEYAVWQFLVFAYRMLYVRYYAALCRGADRAEEISGVMRSPPSPSTPSQPCSPCAATMQYRDIVNELDTPLGWLANGRKVWFGSGPNLACSGLLAYEYRGGQDSVEVDHQRSAWLATYRLIYVS